MSDKSEYRVPLAEDSEYRVKIDGMTPNLESKLMDDFGVHQFFF